jgi:hypothetical protein
MKVIFTTTVKSNRTTFAPGEVSDIPASEAIGYINSGLARKTAEGIESPRKPAIDPKKPDSK